MASYGRRRGKRLTLEELAARTGIALRTLGEMKNRPGYNASLWKLALICRELEITPGELLELGEMSLSEVDAAKREGDAESAQKPAKNKRRKSTKGKKTRRA